VLERREFRHPKKKIDMTRVVIEFPNEATAESFLGWFCDGGGEQQFMMAEQECYAERDGRNPINEFTYERCYPGWGYDPKKHGPDRTIVAHQREKEKP
jgi:hypothetical protein